ncbi:GNAT family N-acetyltransferase [Pseudoflavitalea sp. G-6-1-2]|uniref:GNAT family N-acetyltransferase n=1 Tax=Pseudoflavitalea sp. G-6-1-2 TaxID=2728841 RepID=UPI00146BBF5F|nr:GNAT family N-acetyltransferase [Pseudoflavitalea sp. G-6-1-2]NML22638.1 GNAT family N-acetyltransferase [Pseudoflavitalea sp. G-6-1-2]
MKISSVSSSEYLELTELWERSVRATHHFLKEEPIKYFRAQILNIYLDAVQLSCIRDESGKIQGFMGVLNNKLEMLFVEPNAIGSGVGKELLQHAIDQLGVTKVDVNEANLQALSFYRHMGFVETGRSELDGSGKPFPLIHMELQKQ